jgi:hypothetical protein
VLEDRLGQAAIDLPIIMHQRGRRVRDPPNHRLTIAEEPAEVISLNESVTVPYVVGGGRSPGVQVLLPTGRLGLTIDAATGARSELIAKKP